MDGGKNLASYLDRVPEWVSGYTAFLPERGPSVRGVGYTLRDLHRRGLVDDQAFVAFREETLLDDFAWRLLWVDEDGHPDAESIGSAVRFAEGIVVFIHGWDGSGAIWEDLPALTLDRNPRLLALVPDVNGFGGSPFSTDMPPIEKCDPPALIRAVELWFDLLGVRSPQGAERVRPFVFVGHSMGGAALFFLDADLWRPGEVGRIAAAPALLANDRQRQRFYRTLGAGIQLSSLSNITDRLAENVLAPRLIEALAGWGSERVIAEHHRIYKTTPEGIIARTFAAMGLLDMDFDGDEWPHFHVFLAHKDRLVGLMPALELLEELNFHPAQLRVVLGDHYFFSLGERADLHARNRDLLLRDILDLHADLLAQQEGST
jgi:pimeloyl-ACP methyl ester carboxylesterase